MFLRLWTRAPRTRRTSCWVAVGAMVSFVAKGKPSQRALRALPKLQSIRLPGGASKFVSKGVKGRESLDPPQNIHVGGANTNVIERAKKSEYIEEPQHHSNDHNAIQDGLDRALHRNEAVDQP